MIIEELIKETRSNFSEDYLNEFIFSLNDAEQDELFNSIKEIETKKLQNMIKETGKDMFSWNSEGKKKQ